VLRAHRQPGAPSGKPRRHLRRRRRRAQPDHHVGFQPAVERRPLSDLYYVHDLEHGAIDFLYKCDASDAGASDAGDAGDAGDPCSAMVDQLRQAVASIPTDPLCDVEAGVRVRFVLTPDPLIDHPVTAAAWGWTYNADCVDLATLEAFAKAHYAQGPENFCANGTTQF